MDIYNPFAYNLTDIILVLRGLFNMGIVQFLFNKTIIYNLFFKKIKNKK